MSRDWTPREHYLVEQHNIREGRGDKWHFLSHLVYVPIGKEPVRIVSDEEIALRKQFPVLGKFLEDFTELYDRLSGYENGIAFLQRKDAELAEYIASDNFNSDSYLFRWFEGKLDDRFYYSERNNELLVEYICEEASLETGKQHHLYEVYKQRWYNDNSVSVNDRAQMMSEYTDDVKKGRFDGSFQRYELEFGYHGGQTYGSFDDFLAGVYPEMLAAERAVSAGDYVDVVIAECCDGLAKVLAVSDSDIKLEMVEDRYFMLYPNSTLASNPLEVSFDEILEMKRVDPEKYKYGSFPESLEAVLGSAAARSGQAGLEAGPGKEREFEKE